MKAILKNNQGIAMVVVLTIVVVLLAITGGTLLFSGLGLKVASSQRAGVSAVQMADFGLQHAVATIPVGDVFTSFLTLTPAVSGYTCLNSSGTAGACDGVNFKPTLTGSYNGYSYTVVAENDPAESGTPITDVNKKIVLTVTATGPNGSRKRVQAYVGRSTQSWAPPGAFYFKGTTTNTNASSWDGFSGTSFGVIGNDTNSDGTAGPKPAIPGIATDNNGLRDLIKSQLTAGQYANVTGSGGSPGVATTPTATNYTTLRTNLLTVAGAGVVNRSDGIYDGSGGVTFGTAAAPKITHVTGTDRLSLIGNFTGYGVLIYDGSASNGLSDLSIGENAQFHGLILTNQHIHLDPRVDFGLGGGQTKANGDPLDYGNARIYGGMMMKQVSSQSSFGVDDSNKLYYSSQALLNYVQNYWGSAFIQPAIVLSWVELVN